MSFFEMHESIKELIKREPARGCDNASVRSIPREKRDFERVSQAMVPFERTITVSPTTSAIDALQIMAKNGVGRLVVMDGDRIAGMVTRGDLMKNHESQARTRLVK